MALIIDRRPNGRHKSTVNRQRFIRRYRKHIKSAVGDVINKRSITDIESGGEVTIPKKDLSEPIFHHGRGGVVYHVHPGNKEFNAGDKIQRSGPRQDKKSGSGKASNNSGGVDQFSFQINQEEFLKFLFDDLELPNMIEKDLKDSSNFQYKRAGYTTQGNPDRLNIIRSLRSAHARRIALTGKERKEIKALKRELRQIEVSPENIDKDRAKEIRERINFLNRTIKRFPFLDIFDLKYNNLMKVSMPSSKAVMFCIMDVSGSMTQDIKDIAKRFFFLLYLFLRKNYKEIEVVFVRHHTTAKEVSEEEFFYSRETGGTIVSSALELTGEIIRKRYAPKDWNIYVAQASDGDNWEGDSSVCTKILGEEILNLVQYFAYIEISSRNHQNLWFEYESLTKKHMDKLVIKKIRTSKDIYPVFRQLFERKDA